MHSCFAVTRKLIVSGPALIALHFRFYANNLIVCEVRQIATAVDIPIPHLDSLHESMSDQKSAKINKQQMIVIKGARVHNLKNIDLELPRNRLIVFTGVSGSGKSSLAFDTIYAEGQRRYVESLSAYARQFLERMDKPDVDLIQGISPAVAIEQKTNTRNPRSTVGTSTEIYDYLRLLFGRVGITKCHRCGQIVQKDSVRTAIDRLQREVLEGEKVYILFPFPADSNRTFKQKLSDLQSKGYFRLLVGNDIVDLNEQSLSKPPKEKHFVLVDRLVFHAEDQLPEGSRSRIADSLETAFRDGAGYATIYLVAQGKMLHFSQQFECATCGIKYEEPEPRLFSFNNPYGACPKCQGFGRSVGIDMNLVVPDVSRSIASGAIQPWNFPRFRENLHALLDIAPEAGVRVDVPFRDLTREELDVVMNGYRYFDGINGFFRMIEKKAYKVQYRVFLSRYRGYTTCDLCGGSRLRREALNVYVGGRNIHDIVRMSVDGAKEFFDALVLEPMQEEIARQILLEIRRRLKYLVDVGLGYLTLDRLSNTLSGGETQRINLATALGSSLVGALYVLDEPSVGLHPRDNNKLIAILKSLRDVGNTVIVVEHDADMIKASDIVVDLGPGAGEHGGEVVAVGTVDSIIKHPRSLTGKYLSGEKQIPVPLLKGSLTAARRSGNGDAIFIRGASEHNLKNIDVRIPLHMFVCVTGVSGSGKSTLVHEVLYAGLKKQLRSIARDSDYPRIRTSEDAFSVGRHQAIEGVHLIDDVELVDQSPIGRTPRSNPVTYIGAFDDIRALFASTQQAKIRGYTPGTFSFNVPGGRCDACEGEGYQLVEMQFMADLYLVCEACKGTRYKADVLEIQYQGKNIHDVLNMSVSEAIEFFRLTRRGKRAAEKLQVLEDVGLGYIRLGQPATTLSGGEAQRVKLAAHLAEKKRGLHKLFIFDEPTTGLHFDDVSKLLRCFNNLIEAGNSILVIEHNMDVIKSADWIIDLGPEGGDGGGWIVAEGTPEEVAQNERSYTGKFLKRYLAASL